MKRVIKVSLITMLVVILSGVIGAQAEPPAQPESTAEADGSMAARPPMAPPDLLAKMLTELANALEQPNVSPETLKQMAAQMKQLAALVKQPGMPEGDRMPPMPPQSMDKMAGDMPKINGRPMPDPQRAMNTPMLPDRPMWPMDPLLSLLPPLREMEQKPETLGVMMQMRGEMMQAVGGVMVKYGKVLAETERAARVTQPANPAAATEQPVKTP